MVGITFRHVNLHNNASIIFQNVSETLTFPLGILGPVTVLQPFMMALWVKSGKYRWIKHTQDSGWWLPALHHLSN